jgi:hypothetical protein
MNSKFRKTIFLFKNIKILKIYKKKVEITNVYFHSELETKTNQTSVNNITKKYNINNQ